MPRSTDWSLGRCGCPGLNGTPRAWRAAFHWEPRRGCNLTATVNRAIFVDQSGPRNSIETRIEEIERNDYNRIYACARSLHTHRGEPDLETVGRRVSNGISRTRSAGSHSICAKATGTDFGHWELGPGGKPPVAKCTGISGVRRPRVSIPMQAGRRAS